MDKNEFDTLFNEIKSELDKEMVEKIKQDASQYINNEKEPTLADLINLSMYESNYFSSQLIYKLLSEIFIDKPI